MYLKATRCSDCGGRIMIIPYRESERKVVVSHGACEYCLKNTVLPCEEFYGFCAEHGADEETERRVLECSSKGDKRFSSLFARVSVYGRMASIEEHYQLSKSFNGVRPTNWREFKGKEPTCFVIRGKEFAPNFLGSWYTLLWVKYLDEHPELVEYAKGFDDFTDMFRGKSRNSQAVVIRKYVKEGREACMADCREFAELLASTFKK